MSKLCRRSNLNHEHKQMNTMKSIIPILLISLPCLAAEIPLQQVPAPPIPVESKIDESILHKGLFADTFYTLRFSDGFSHPDQGAGVGVGYAFTPNILGSVRGTHYLDQDVGLNELAGRLTLRGDFVHTRIILYAFTEGGANLQSGVGFGGAGGGIELRPIWKWLGLGAEVDLRENTDWRTSIGLTAFAHIGF